MTWNLFPHYWPFVRGIHRIAKLAAYVFHLSACKLIASYLHNRKQCVKIQGKISAPWSDVVKAVPQGSILGHLLFNIFINIVFLLDMSCSIYNYTDDSCISYAHDNVDCIKSVLSHKIKSLMACFKLNSLKANPNKFQLMLISSNGQKDNDLQIEVNDNVITATSIMKILCMHIDDKLNLNGHGARHLFFPQLGSRTTIKQYGLVRNRNLLGHYEIFFLFR